MDELRIKEMSQNMRKNMLDVSLHCKMSVHMGGGLSLVDIVATLYGAILKFDIKNPTWEGRDKFILSKGHGVLGYFSALYEVGLIDKDKFFSFQANESDLIAHPVMKLKLGIESSNGSLGHGLAMGIGLAIAAKKKKKDNRTFVLMGDGECNEGSVWEAAMSASHFKLDNLTAIVDFNGLQSDGDSKKVLDSGDFVEKWKCFGWDVYEVDGHNVNEIYNAFNTTHVEDKPKAIIARTVKGKGVAFMENNNEWHHNRLTETLYNKALEELNMNL
jgi:transketolase